MAKKLSLNLTKVIEDTRVVASAVGLSNAEQQVGVEVSDREQLRSAIWAAESLLENLQLLSERSEAQYEEVLAEERLKAMDERQARQNRRAYNGLTV